MTTTVKELAYVGIEASDLDAWSDFLGQLLGVMPARHTEDVRTFRIDDRIHRHIIERGPKNDVSFVGYDCGSDADLEEVVALLRAQGHEVTEGDEALRTERGVQRVFITHDPEQIRVELITGLAAATEPYRNDVNTGGFQTQQGGAGHIFLLCGEGMRDVMLEFYGYLGFKLSDYIKEEMAPGVYIDAAFTHCNGRHHTLAIAEAPAPFKLHHFLIENNLREDVGLAYDRILEARVPLLMTLGMHPNDKMFSFYAHSPSGVAVEFGWGGLIIEDDEAWEVTQYDAISMWGHKNSRELGKWLIESADRGDELQRAAVDEAVAAAAEVQS
ncbi:VOC family protein [Rhodococcus artemisiae]|uniref:VOC family protein n=1 Tax=Rhodococcus artemisiae TaxID=714159 RepID=A0ABU7LI76_9NOCA|nr:VOC family protein [Rhodococcus artemisiae]MEE2061210.1 VOC family protein [Rhodococcus artemisiae]